MVPYGKRLVKLRGEKSQAKVAEDVGIATSTFAMYESEQRVPRDDRSGSCKIYGDMQRNLLEKKERSRQDVIREI